MPWAPCSEDDTTTTRDGADSCRRTRGAAWGAVAFGAAAHAGLEMKPWNRVDAIIASDAWRGVVQAGGPAKGNGLARWGSGCGFSHLERGQQELGEEEVRQVVGGEALFEAVGGVGGHCLVRFRAHPGIEEKKLE